MPSKIFLTTLAANAIFLATGALELGFSLVVQNQKDSTPKNGKDATQNLLYQDFPLTAGIVNGALIIAVFFLTLPGFLTPSRNWLKLSGYAITGCGLFSMCLGLYIWIMTLQIKETFSSTYTAQDASVQELIQTSFECCGYLNSTSPAFVTDETCPSPAAAALMRGCATFISSFANTFIDRIFTALFGMVGVDALLILLIVCLLKDRKERERYRHIDEKNGI